MSSDDIGYNMILYDIESKPEMTAVRTTIT